MKHTARRWLQGTAVALVLSLSAPAWAEIWGFVDKRGVSHFADHQIDRRYELFYRGGQRAARKPPGMAPGAAYAPQLQARFAVSTSYKAVRHLIREAATAYGLEYELLKAVIATESGFDPGAVSPSSDGSSGPCGSVFPMCCVAATRATAPAPGSSPPTPSPPCPRGDRRDTRPARGPSCRGRQAASDRNAHRYRG